MIEQELAEMSAEPPVSKTTNRSVLGWMNDVAFHASYIRRDKPAASPLAMGLELAGMPCVAADLTPDDATLEVFGLKTPRPPTPPRPPPVVKPEVPKAVKKQLRMLVNLAHQREMHEALVHLESRFAQWKAQEIHTGELLDEIHRFHDGTSRDLYKLYVMSPPQLSVAAALRNRVVSEAEAGSEVMALLRMRL
jgi:hypothetical protein